MKNSALKKIFQWGLPTPVSNLAETNLGRSAVRSGRYLAVRMRQAGQRLFKPARIVRPSEMRAPTIPSPRRIGGPETLNLLRSCAPGLYPFEQARSPVRQGSGLVCRICGRRTAPFRKRVGPLSPRPVKRRINFPRKRRRPKKSHCLSAG